MKSETPKLHVLYNNICNVLRTIFDCFLQREYISTKQIHEINFHNPRNHLPIEQMYFGDHVSNKLKEDHLTNKQINFVRFRCLKFYVEACKQITNRFNKKNSPVEMFSFMDPSRVKKGDSLIADVAALFPNLVRAKNVNLDSEGRKLRNTSKKRHI